MHANGQNAITIEYLYTFYIFYKYKKPSCTTYLNFMHAFFKKKYIHIWDFYIKFIWCVLMELPLLRCCVMMLIYCCFTEQNIKFSATDLSLFVFLLHWTVFFKHGKITLQVWLVGTVHVNAQQHAIHDTQDARCVVNTPELVRLLSFKRHFLKYNNMKTQKHHRISKHSNHKCAKDPHEKNNQTPNRAWVACLCGMLCRGLSQTNGCVSVVVWTLCTRHTPEWKKLWRWGDAGTPLPSGWVCVCVFLCVPKANQFISHVFVLSGMKTRFKLFCCASQEMSFSARETKGDTNARKQKTRRSVYFLFFLSSFLILQNNTSLISWRSFWDVLTLGPRGEVEQMGV